MATKLLHTSALLLVFISMILSSCDGSGLPKSLKHGDKIDSLNGVGVYYNSSFSKVSGRSTTADGYNLGLKYQCVEFVKRYYYQALNHKMPNPWGHAYSFFNSNVADGQLNSERDLIQYSNPSLSKPKVNDLVVFEGSLGNSFGHVAIISKVGNSEIEIVQQNVGSNSRQEFDLVFENGTWRIESSRLLGWL
jgi:hypothetical protein